MSYLDDIEGRFVIVPPGTGVSLADIASVYRRFPDDVPGAAGATAGFVEPLSGAVIPSERAQGKFNRIADTIVDGLKHWIQTPGEVYAGKYNVEPEAPGQWSEADEFRQQQAQRDLRNWAAGTALGMVGLGRLPGGAPAGAVGSGGAKLVQPGRPNLPMDETSRMALAREMGFYTDAPLYHGTATEFPAFSPTPPARNSRGPLAQTGVSTTKDPAYASDFAALSAYLGTGSYPQVLPLLHRAEKSARVDATGLSMSEMAGAVRDAWAAGHDAVLVQNYTRGAFGKVAPTEHVIVRNPNQLRSRFAAFDPAKRDINDLLAALFAVPAMGVVGAAMKQGANEETE